MWITAIVADGIGAVEASFLDQRVRRRVRRNFVALRLDDPERFETQVLDISWQDRDDKTRHDRWALPPNSFHE